MKRVYLDIETYSEGEEPAISDKVIAIGILDESQKSKPCLLTEWKYEEEKVIREFYEILSKKYNESIIVGFNILRFDIPVLFFKGITYGVGDADMLYKLWHKPPIIDYRQVLLPLHDMRFKGLSLAYLAQLLSKRGVPHVPEREDGEVVKELYRNQRYERIDRHLSVDLENSSPNPVP